jgi:undecaprenyl-diphosphatase
MKGDAMRIPVGSVTRWDIIFFTSIFALDGKKLVAWFMPRISHTGNGYYYPLLPLLICFFSPDKALDFLTAGIIAFLFELPAHLAIKNLVKRDRPCDVLANVNRRITPSDKFSFPSGHTAAAFAMATLISFHFPILTLPVMAWALLVGFSRIYLGVHYPTDILAGIVIGVTSGLSGVMLIG